MKLLCEYYYRHIYGLICTIIFSFFWCQITHAQEGTEWETILHSSNEYSDITNPEFFRSQSNLIEIEKKQAIESLNSDHPENYACVFPSRYLYLHSKSLVPRFDLDRCIELKLFLDHFQYQKVNIVYSTEHFKSASSAFGHVMLLFERDDGNLLTSEAVHFSAVHTGEDGFFKFAYRGINGGYTGKFIREPFFKKIHEYNEVQQRYLFIYPLQLSQDEVYRLKIHLFELISSNFKYYFLKKNCAYRLDEILSIALNKRKENNFGYSLPISLIQQYSTHLGAPRRILPSSVKMMNKYNSLNEKEKGRISEIIHQNQFSEELNEKEKEVIAEYAKFNFRSNRNADENYSKLSQFRFPKTEVADEKTPPHEKIKPSKIGIGYFSNSDTSGLSISFRPVQTDIKEPQGIDNSYSELSLMRGDLEIGKRSLVLKQLDMISIKQFPKTLLGSTPSSWNLYSGIRKENLKNELKLSNELGWGKSINGETWMIGFIQNLGFEANHHSAAAHLKPSFTLIYEIPNKIRFTSENFWKTATKEPFLGSNNSLRFRLGDWMLGFDHLWILQKHQMQFQIIHNF